MSVYSKTCLKQPLKRRPKIGFQDPLSFNASQTYCRMLKEHSAIRLTCIKLPSIFKTYVLSILEWPLKTGFTVCICASTQEFGTYRMGEHMCSLARAFPSHIHKERKWRKAQIKNLNFQPLWIRQHGLK